MINRPICDPLSRLMIPFAMGIFAVAIALASSHRCLATDVLSTGSSSKQHRKQTVSSLPYHQLNQQTKDKIADVLNKPSIYRQLPVTSINADPDYFRFLVRYPEVIVNIWQLMGVTKMTTERTGPYSMTTDDGAGTISSLELVYGNDNLHIFYGTGSYQGPILKRKLHGKCVLVLQSETQPDGQGKPVTTSKLDVFLKIDNATAGLIAKTIQPLIGTTADHNFVESLKFVQRLNETTSKNGPGVQRMGSRLNIDAGVRQRFNDVVDVVFERAINGQVAPENRSAIQPAGSQGQYSMPPQSIRSHAPTSGRQIQSSYPIPVYPPQSNLGPGVPGALYSNVQNVSPGRHMPARGHRAPSYHGANPGGAANGHPGFPYETDYGRPRQATYQYSQPGPSNVQPTGHWVPRQP